MGKGQKAKKTMSLQEFTADTVQNDPTALPTAPREDSGYDDYRGGGGYGDRGNQREGDRYDRGPRTYQNEDGERVEIVSQADTVSPPSPPPPSPPPFPPPLPPPPETGCSKVCMYVSVFPQMGAPQLLHASSGGPEFFQSNYHHGVDYHHADNVLPNNNYGTDTMGVGAAAHVPMPFFHPSETKAGVDTRPGPGAAYDVITGKHWHSSEPYIWEDTVQEVSSGDGAELYHSTPTKHVRDYLTDAVSGHFFGKATCEVMNICAVGALPGEQCTSPMGDMGFCFETSGGPHELMCGRLLSLNDEYDQTPIALDLPSGPYRCPRGSHVLEMGTVAVSRLLMGGCMCTNAVNYDPLAEIHVQPMCEYSGAAMPSIIEGCMFPGAENFNPLAQSPTKCQWLTNGCTSQTALNYNSEATTNDDSCIEPVYGCTLGSALVGGSEISHAYSGIESGTPKYESLYFGSALRSVGIVNLPDYKAATNFNPSATVNQGCEVAVEGCMDSTAVNYYSKATINSQSWCIPPVTGCMMPAADYASPGKYENSGVHQRQALSIDFDPTATVPGECTVYYKGCMNSNATNYDEFATVPDDCYFPRYGCLDTTALNYGCLEGGITTCEHDTLPAEEQITINVPGICSYNFPEPPSPPPPKFPDSTSTETQYQTVVSFESSQQYTEAEIDAIKADMAQEYGVDQSKVLIDVIEILTSRRRLERGRQLATRYEVIITILSDSPEAAEALTTKVEADLNDFDKAAALLPGLLTLPVVNTQTVVIALTPPSPPPGDGGLSGGAIAGIVVGAVVGVALIGVIAFCILKKKGGAKEVAPNY